MSPKTAATLDQLSGGRIILTIGAGGYEHEFKAYGLPFDKHGVRIQREREIIQILKALWTRDEIRNRLSGTTADIIQRIKEYERAGIDHMNLVFLDPADLQLFTSQVMPVIRQS